MEKQIRQVEVFEGNLLNCTEDIIVHQVNTKGQMRSGIAKQIKEKYPEVYEYYRSEYDACDLGDCLVAKTKDGKYVANIFAQSDYGTDVKYMNFEDFKEDNRDRKQYTNYQALYAGLRFVRDFAQSENLSVAIPHGIGCGRGGGNWEVVNKEINNIFSNFNEVKIYRL